VCVCVCVCGVRARELERASRRPLRAVGAWESRIEVKVMQVNERGKEI